MPNLVTTAATTVGALDSGSITSGFGSIDTGSSTITTTGLISGGSLDIDNVLINGSTIGHTDDTDLITLANGIATVAGEISVTTLDIGGTNVTSTAAELNILDGVTATATEINLIDGNTSTGTTAVADADGIITNDGGTIGVSSDADSITIASDGVVTFSQAPVFPDGSIAVVDLDIDGATDIGEAIVDADLFIVDNGAGGTNRKVAASRIVTYIDANSSAASVGKAIAMAIVFG